MALTERQKQDVAIKEYGLSRLNGSESTSAVLNARHEAQKAKTPLRTPSIMTRFIGKVASDIRTCERNARIQEELDRD